MAQGRNNAAVAGALGLSERAVEKHINSVFSKLDLSEEPDAHRRVKAVLLYLADRPPRSSERGRGPRNPPPRAAWIGGALGLVVQFWMITEEPVAVLRSATPATSTRRPTPGSPGTGGSPRRRRPRGHRRRRPHADVLRAVGRGAASAVRPLHHAFDSRLSGVSMLLAAALAVYGGATRAGAPLRRPHAPWSTADTVATAVVAFVVPAGTTLLIWGAAPSSTTRHRRGASRRRSSRCRW